MDDMTNKSDDQQGSEMPSGMGDSPMGQAPVSGADSASPMPGGDQPMGGPAPADGSDQVGASASPTSGGTPIPEATGEDAGSSEGGTEKPDKGLEDPMDALDPGPHDAPQS